MGEEHEALVRAGVDQVGQKHGVVGYVGAAQVEQPGYVGQVVEEVAVGLEPGCDAEGGGMELVGRPAARPLFGLDHDGGGGQGRAVGPDGIEGVGQPCAQGQSGLTLQPAGRGGSEHVVGPGHDETGPVLYLASQPADGRGGPRLSLAHQLEGRVAQLFGGLQPVAAVGPEGGTVEGDDGGSGRAGEAGEPLATHPVGRYVLIVVRVGGRYQVGIDPVVAHPAAQCFDALVDSHDAWV